MNAKYLFLIFFLLALPRAHAQEISFKDTIAAYNKHRVAVDKRGMEVLGSWGLANIVAGGIGSFTAKQDEWKYFHEMNAAVGVINAGRAAFSLGAMRGEMRGRLNSEEAYGLYLANKRFYLVSASVDVVFIAAGIGLAEYSTTAKNNPQLYRGFGKSIALQGIFLLLFDNFMFASHQRNNSKWYILMGEIRITNNGVGINHTF